MPPASCARDSALRSLLLVARLKGCSNRSAGVDVGTGDSSPLTASGLCQAARDLGLVPRWVRPGAQQLARLALPALAVLEDGECVVLAGVRDSAVLVQLPGALPVVWQRWMFMARWRGDLLLLEPAETVEGSAPGGAQGWLRAALHPERRALLEVLGATLFLQLLALAAPLFFQVVTDKVLVHHRLATLDVLCVGLLLAILFEMLLGHLRSRQLAEVGLHLEGLLSARFLRHLLALPLTWFEGRRVGDTLSCVREIEQLRGFLTGPALGFACDLVFASGFLVLLLAYHVGLALVVVVGLALQILLVALCSPLLRSRLEARAGRHADAQASLVESLSGIAALKAAAAEPAEVLRWERLAHRAARASASAIGFSSLLAQGSACLQKLGVLVTLWLGARLVIGGELSVGELVGFNLIAARITQPALRLAQCWQEFQQATLAMRRLDSVLRAIPESVDKHLPMPTLRGQIRFERVSFRYRPEGPEVLRDLDLDLPPNAVIGVVGASGSGKSTLANLLQRLCVPQQGQILLDGLPLARYSPRVLRQQIGVVQQEPRLFNRSVRENIALRDPDVSMAKVIEAARLAGAHEFILQLPAGYGTVLGEHGTSLSGGQRQRIALARALVTNPRLLILDEATSALDYETEARITRHLPQLAEGRSVLLIAHRLLSVSQAQRILVIEAGRLVEEGTHTELLTRNGVYARLWKVQRAGLTGVAA